MADERSRLPAPKKKEPVKADPPKRLILCFDGTGNKFNANEIDSNIVKIYEMLDRNTNDQYHYYQRK
jgi:uncharacterized protein (DUF2235 family)